MARREGLTFLGALPVDTSLVSLLDGDKDEDLFPPLADPSDAVTFELARRYKSTSSAKLFDNILVKLLDRIAALSASSS